MTARSFLFLLGSSRADGNTEDLARLAAEQLPTGTGQRWLNLSELTLPDFEDLRHEGDGSYPAPTGHAATLLEATLGATDLVLTSPLYWYAVVHIHQAVPRPLVGVDAGARRRLQGSGWPDAPCGASPRSRPPTGASPNRRPGRCARSPRTCGWYRGGMLLGTGNRPGDVLNDPAATAHAKHFFG